MWGAPRRRLCHALGTVRGHLGPRLSLYTSEPSKECLDEGKAVPTPAQAPLYRPDCVDLLWQCGWHGDQVLQLSASPYAAKHQLRFGTFEAFLDFPFGPCRSLPGATPPQSHQIVLVVL